MDNPQPSPKADNAMPDRANTHVGLCAGAAIMTAAGERNVESLSVDDQVLTLSGILRTVRRIVRLHANDVSAPALHQAVRIKAGALSARCPRRDLIVAPHQALIIDGLLVSASLLVNDISVVREPAGPVEYFLVELDGHDAIWAEGAALEASAMSGVNAKDNGGANTRAGLPPDLTVVASSVVRAFKPTNEPDAIRRRLAARSGFYAPVPESALSGAVEFLGPDEVRGWARNDLQPEMPVCLDVLVDGQLVMQVLANQYRPDLKQATQNLGFHGFAAKLPKGIHGTIAVRRSSDRKHLPRALQNHAA